MAFIIIGAICIIYFCSIAVFTGLGSKFPLVWLAAGVVFIGVGIAVKTGWLYRISFPKWIKTVFFIFLITGSIIFLSVEVMILNGYRNKSVDNLDYIVVLGAQMKENGPSKSLRMRLDEAYEYLVQNETTIVIVSGGQGSNEPISEAEGMYQYLCEKGIAPNRIIKEDKSENTHQNLVYSKRLIAKKDAAVGIVSNNFHIFRALGLAKKAGYEKVYGIPAKSEPFLQPNNMAREFCGVVKDFLAGNL